MLLKAVLNSPLGIAREMDRLFETMNSSQPMGFIPTIRPQWSYPSMNIWEDAEHIYAEAELPGMGIDDVEVLVAGDQLTIRGSRNVRAPEHAQALRRERPVGQFERTMVLPTPVDAEHVEAKLSNGVLAIAIPKVEEARPRKVEIKAHSSGS